MENKHRKFNGQVEINDLIVDAVNSAIARRQQHDNSEEDLSALFEDEATNVRGGIKKPNIVTSGIWTVEPPIC